MTIEAATPSGTTEGEGAEPASARPARSGAAGMGHTLRELPVLFLIAVAIAFVVKTFLAQAFYIPSGSMLEQLQINDRVVVSKLAYKLHEPRRGDIVVFDSPNQDTPGFTPEPDRGLVGRIVHFVFERVGIVQPTKAEFIKRVIGLPGETVEGRDGKVWVNGRELVEPYLRPGMATGTFAPVTVPRDSLWVMGDNRGGSFDSRYFGAVEQDTVVGRAFVRVWPPSSASFL